MIHLLFSLVFLEMALVVVLLFKTPLRMLLMLGLDRLKRGRGRLIAGTAATTMVVIFGSAVYNVLGVQRRLANSTIINPTDQVLMANSLLEASLMGFSLFLGILIDRLHYYVKELYLLRNNFEATKKWKRDYVQMDSIETSNTSSDED
ncbi:Endoplasmic reticulum transmembrane protein [Psidium guajava]|nr:Endoplasmic reticulum transmembrane protein [Psidium guajava]